MYHDTVSYHDYTVFWYEYSSFIEHFSHRYNFSHLTTSILNNQIWPPKILYTLAYIYSKILWPTDQVYSLLLIITPQEFPPYDLPNCITCVNKTLGYISIKVFYSWKTLLLRLCGENYSSYKPFIMTSYIHIIRYLLYILVKDFSYS